MALKFPYWTMIWLLWQRPTNDNSKEAKFTLTFKENDVPKIQCTHLHSVSKNNRDFVLKLRNYIISLCPLFSFGIVGIMRHNYYRELWVLWGTTTIENRGYYEAQLPSGIVGIMRYNYHQILWVFWGTTTIRNCGYCEAQLSSGIVGIMSHNYRRELWVIWGTTTNLSYRYKLFVISSKVYFTIKCKASILNLNGPRPIYHTN